VYKYFPKNRWKYLARIAINSMKGLRQLQLKESWYNLIGIIEFLKMKKTLAYTPVSEKSQQTFLQYFWSTKPAFEFVKRDVSNLFKKTALKKT
uniref:hypothetical protein n=1 Tax=uncultured Mucilaginibacter sp. TaxID=797541 RepID=UPI002619F08F